MVRVFFKVGLEADYQRLKQEGKLQDNALYYITDTQRMYKGNLLMAVGKEASTVAAGLLSPEDKQLLDSLTGKLDEKVDKKIVGDKGASEFIQEADGGGIFFTGEEYKSFVGVNEDVEDGIGAQLYDINKDTNKGSKLDVTANGIYYTTGDESAKPASQRDIEANEIATRKDIEGLVGVLHFRGVFNSLDEVTDPKNGDVVIVGSKEYVYVNVEGQPIGWREFGDEGIYETKAEAEVEHAALSTAIAAEEARAKAAEATKTTEHISGTNGESYIWNEQSGGGARFENKNGVESFVGVNDGTNGLVAQIYADKLVDGKWQGAKLDVTNGGMYYTVGNKSAIERMVAENEVATKGDIVAALEWLPIAE